MSAFFVEKIVERMRFSFTEILSECYNSSMGVAYRSFGFRKMVDG